MMWIINHTKHINTPEVYKFQNGVYLTIKNRELNLFRAVFSNCLKKCGFVFFYAVTTGNNGSL